MSKIFFVGIGGAGMNKLALLLKDFGDEIFGSDIKNSKETEKLQNKGINIYIGHNKNHINKSIDLVIYSSAIPSSNEELIQAKKIGITVKKRGEALAEITKKFKTIVVSGTHGKTTTTAFIGYILKENGKKTNVYIGGEEEEFDSFDKTAELFVIESDESDRSFLFFEPKILVITNIDKDHLGAYQNSFKNLKQAFKTLQNKSEKKVICRDDKNAFSIANLSDTNTFFYSIKNKKANIFATNIKYSASGTEFDLFYLRKFIERGFIPSYGDKNVLNALAAISVAHLSGIKIKDTLISLESFSMPNRRMKIRGEIKGITVIDDHADHPTEIESTLNAIKKHFPSKRIIAVFQPHRYSRVNALKQNIAKPFHYADIIISTDIYPAFEAPIKGINGSVINKWIKEKNEEKEVYYGKQLEDVTQILRKILKRNDLIVLLGPGDIENFSHSLIRFLKGVACEKKH